ncbi:sialoadhesin-like [Polymixia lowei]
MDSELVNIPDGVSHSRAETRGGLYWCRGGRGSPVYYTQYSDPIRVTTIDEPKPVLSVSLLWSTPGASVTLTCKVEQSSEGWKFYWFKAVPKHSDSSYTYELLSGSENGTIVVLQLLSHGVYWCESGSGGFSNAVNITVHNGDVILVSPVHPVTEGVSVTLGCKHNTKLLPSKVDFYLNDKLIQNGTNREMIITAVSKSDEGFYKCKYDGTDSPQSWMAVKLSRPVKEQAMSSLFLVGLCVGLVVVFLVIILLILLLHYRKSKDPHDRSIQLQNTNQGSATDQSVNQREAPDDDHYVPLQHDGANVYETIKGSEETENGGPVAEPSDVTYSQFEHKNFEKKGE